jgi:dephospho-CoA kinase
MAVNRPSPTHRWAIPRKPGTKRRDHRRWPFITSGLTGSIAMGKSTAANLLRRLNWPVFNADAAVHRLMVAGGAAVPLIAAAFNNVIGPRGVDRVELGRRVFGDPDALRRLEKIIHPMVRREHRRFYMKAALNRFPAVIIDVPLLFEGGGDRNCDSVVVVSAPAFLQRQRAMARPGMTAAKLNGILAQQMPDYIKRRRADIVVPSGLGKREALRRLLALRKVVRTKSSGE